MTAPDPNTRANPPKPRTGDSNSAQWRVEHIDLIPARHVAREDADLCETMTETRSPFVRLGTIERGL